MSKLGNVLQRMKVMLQQLTEILDAERLLLLENGSAQQLSEIIDKKTQLLVNLKLLDEERIDIGRQDQIEPPYKSVDSLEKQWSAIEDQTASLSNRNRENGIIMQSRMDRTLKKINFLNTINNNMVYTHGGYVQNNSVSKKRAEA